MSLSKPTASMFKPKSINNKCLLLIQPNDIMKLIFGYLNHTDYLSLTSSCKSLKKYHEDESVSNNYILDYIKIMRLVFDLRKNVFITGSAGTGKTFIMNKVYEKARELEKRVVATATTGIASTNLVEGRTIHSFSGLRKGNIPIEKLREGLAAGTIKPPKVWEETDLLLIDEISMNGSRFLDKLNMVAQHRRDNNKALGGLQVVASGDFLQLKPVADNYPFVGDVWPKLKFEIICLRYPFRQSQDISYYRLLQRIRKGETTTGDVNWLKDRYEYTKKNMKEIEAMPIKPTRFKARQKDVQNYNKEQFDKLETPIEHTLNAQDAIFKRHKVEGGKYRYENFYGITLNDAYEILKDRTEHQAPSSISFRQGAQYMLTFNFNVKKKHVNGSKCVYIGDGQLQFSDGSILTLSQVEHQFSYNLGGDVFLFRKQVAVRLAYACTFHSSQGLTVESAMIDLGPTIFDSGQAYVGLSRVKTASGLFIENFSERSLKTNELAKDFMQAVEDLTINKKKIKKEKNGKDEKKYESDDEVN